MSPLGGFGGGAMGTGLGLGMLIMPISIAALILRRPAGPIRKLIAAGAISPEMARRSHGVGIPREDVLRPYRRFGVVHRTDDGRWYVDRRRERRVRWILWGLIGVFALVLAVIVWVTMGQPRTQQGGLP